MSEAIFNTVISRVRGRSQARVSLSHLSWFRVGGAADWLVRPADVDDLVAILASAGNCTPVTVLGAASNMIIRDGGLPGVALKLGRAFGEVSIESDGVVAGAAALDATVSEHAATSGLVGLEFLSGIPGSIGGAVWMNAGCYGREVKDCLDWVEIASSAGLYRLSASRCGFGYRHASLPAGSVVVRARFHAVAGDAGPKMAEIRALRAASQPLRVRTGGSTFKNPVGQKAWQLIDAAGCRGLRLGGAQVSEKHCNFLLNIGGSTATELEALGEQVRSRVLEMSGVHLEWEIKRIGLSP